MEFTDVIFLFLALPIFLISYYIVKDKYKNLVIVLTSFFVFCWGLPYLILQIVCFSVLNYAISYLLSKIKKKTIKTITLTITIVLNFCALFMIIWYSYNVKHLRCCTHKHFGYVWISVFFMNGISYILDVYKKRVEFSSNIINYFVYIFMFYKFYFGPPMPYYKLKKSIEKRDVSIDMVVDGIENFILGLSKIAIFSYEIGQVRRFVILKIYDVISLKTEGISITTAWIGLVAMFFDVYFYFSGYFDIAKGLGKITGFKFSNNIDNKIFCTSVTKFFQHFNIVFTNYFKFYVFPWVGSKGKAFKIFKCLAIYLLYNLCFWKIKLILYFFTIILLERLFLKKILQKIPKYARKIYSFILILFGFCFVFIDEPKDVLLYIKFLFGGSGVFFDKSLIFVAVFFRFVAVLASFHILQFILNWAKKKKERFLKAKSVLNYAFNLVLFLVSICYCLTF